MGIYICRSSFSTYLNQGSLESAFYVLLYLGLLYTEHNPGTTKFRGLTICVLRAMWRKARGRLKANETETLSFTILVTESGKARSLIILADYRQYGLIRPTRPDRRIRAKKESTRTRRTRTWYMQLLYPPDVLTPQ